MCALHVTTRRPELSVLPVRELAVSARDGCRSSLDELFRRVEPLMRQLSLKRLGNAADADDALQDAFLLAVRWISRLKKPESFQSWMGSIVLRCCLQHSVRKRFKHDLLSGEHQDQRARSPLDEAAASERAQGLRAVVATLRPLDRVTLEQFYLEGLSILEMTRDGTPEGTVKRRLKTARERFKEALERCSWN